MSSPASGLLSTPTIWGKVDYGPTFGQVYRPLNQKRIVTSGNPILILPYDTIVIVQFSIPSDWFMTLPDLNLWMSSPIGGFDLIVKNLNVGYKGTVTGVSGQTVDGSPVIEIGDSQGIGATIISPLPSKTGWVTL